MRFAVLLLALTACLLAESAAGIKWAAPPGWTSSGASPMRAATYTIPGGAECVVYFFGQGQGGSVDANIARWKSQFSVNGQPAPASVAHKTVHGLNVTTMDASGTYTGAGGPMMTAQAPKPDYRMLAAIVEGAGGSLFVKFTGPAAAVKSNEAKFNNLVASFQKE